MVNANKQKNIDTKNVITFCASRGLRKMYCGHPRLCVCLFAAECPHYCTDPDVLGGFAISARVALLWQHNKNPNK